MLEILKGDTHHRINSRICTCSGKYVRAQVNIRSFVWRMPVNVFPAMLTKMRARKYALKGVQARMCARMFAGMLARILASMLARMIARMLARMLDIMRATLSDHV